MWNRFSFPSWFAIGLLAGLALSIPFLGRDLAVMLAWEEAATDSGWLQWWARVASRSVFKGGNLGAQDISHALLILVLAAYAASFWPRVSNHHPMLRARLAYYLACLLCFFLVNRGMKLFFGRVRPADIHLGDFSFTPMWSFGGYNFFEALTKGSFTSGHTTVAMALLPAAFICLRSWRIAAPVFVLALSWGLFVGWGRVINGSHYPSDILWAVVVCIWICAMVQTYLISPHQAWAESVRFWDIRLLTWFALALFFLFCVATGIKEMVFRFAWWWPAISVLASFGVWASFRRVLALTRLRWVWEMSFPLRSGS